MPLESSPESPVPVRTASRLLGDWIRRTGEIWVEGQIAQLRLRQATAWITLRDADADMSIPLKATAGAVAAASIGEGHRVVARIRPDYWIKNGSVTWQALEFRPVGIGALMQRLEEVRRLLAAEGLFRDEHKRPLPFLPRRIGVVCGRGSAARHDVVVNARTQWPAADFVVREVAVQGTNAVAEIIGAVRNLDGIADVDVIVITRGGGSFEDLLPFSNEALVRLVSACSTPVVSAIGHEEDNPLLDAVADVRASTPTAAGKMVVPDLATEQGAIAQQRERLRRLVRHRLDRERQQLNALVNRPVMTSPARLLQEHRERVTAARRTIRSTLTARLDGERHRLHGLRQRPALSQPGTMVTTRRTEITGLAARLRAMSPQATLDRGYAVVRTTEGQLLASVAEVLPPMDVRVLLADGYFDAGVTAPPTPRDP